MCFERYGGWEKEGGEGLKKTNMKKIDIYRDNLINPLGKSIENNLLEHELLTVTPVIFSYSRKSHVERLFDEFFQDPMQTIFIDLDARLYTTASLRSSGSRATYQNLSEIFENKKVPTIIPVLVKRELLHVFLFPRFIGSTIYPRQWRDMPEEFKKKGYSCFSYVSRKFPEEDISIFLDPENKEIPLITFYKSDNKP